MMHIRMANQEDAIPVYRLAKDFATSFVVHESAFAHAFHTLLTEPNAYLAVATDEDIDGYLLGFDHYTFFANGRVAWVEEITVRQDCRRRGIGWRLMQAFESWARDRQAKLVALATRRAAPFYQAIGYEESATYFRKLL
jgi:GNAT superfamily N-acetyltransferase